MVSEEKNFLEKRLGAKEKLIKGNYLPTVAIYLRMR